MRGGFLAQLLDEAGGVWELGVDQDHLDVEAGADQARVGELLDAVELDALASDQGGGQIGAHVAFGTEQDPKHGRPGAILAASGARVSR